MTNPQPANWFQNPVSGAACAIIAEVAQAHDGSLGMAHAFIDSAARSGAHAVKFQTHIAAAESTAGEPWRVKFSKQDETRYDYWKRMEFTADQWAGLKTHAEDKGLVFLSSPFSMEAVALLRNLGIAGWKVASGELTNLPMLAEMGKDKKPLLLSSGMSPMTEIDAAVGVVRKAGSPFAIFQCTTKYPSPPENIGLNVLPELRERFACAVGLSDHSGTIYPALAASAAHSIEVLEVHLTLSRDMFGPDVVASVTPAELKQIVEGISFIERMRASPADKSTVSAEVSAMRDIFFKSVVAARDLPAGTVLKLADLALKKPGTGIPARDVESLVGRKLAKAIACDAQILMGDIS